MSNKTMSSNIIGVGEARTILNVSRAKMKKLISKGVVPVLETITVVNTDQPNGKTTVHDRDAILELRDQMAEKSRAAVTKKAKQRAAKDANKKEREKQLLEQFNKEFPDLKITIRSGSSKNDNGIFVTVKRKVFDFPIHFTKGFLYDINLLKNDFQSYANKINDFTSTINDSIDLIELQINMKLENGFIKDRDRFISILKEKMSKNNNLNMQFNEDDNFIFERVKSEIGDQFWNRTLKTYCKEYIEQNQNVETGLSDYISLFPLARSMKRKFIAHLGPTNSGKTYTAMTDLINSDRGAYLAPLRLMALEGYEKLLENNIPTNMSTGEELIISENANHYSSTIEMADFENYIDVAIIDEIQMLADKSRGWAWTQAAIGLPASRIHMTGSADALPLIKKIVEMTGDELEVIEYERKNDLIPLNKPVPYEKIEDGDAIIVFSRKEIFNVRNRLKGKKVSVIYGALSPECRREEARRFREGETKYLIATDAIAMGLNMPIKRVLFSTLEKYNGLSTVRLTTTEIKQISGRAGRYGLSENGYAGVMIGNDPAIVIDELAKNLKPLDHKLYVMPPYSAVYIVASLHQTDDLVYIFRYIADNSLKNHPVMTQGSLDDAIKIAKLLENTMLPLQVRFKYIGCPVDLNNQHAIDIFAEWAQQHGLNEQVEAPQLKNLKTPKTTNDLHDYTDAVKQLGFYLWLARKWPNIFFQNEEAKEARDNLNTIISDYLATQNFTNACRECRKPLPKNHQYAICNSCYNGLRYNRYY